MSLEITVSPPLIRVTDTDGHVVFNTTEKLFYARAADVVTATITTAVHNTGTAITDDHYLGSVDASATFVRGKMKVTGYASTTLQDQGPPINRSYNVSGTYVHLYTMQFMHTFTPFVSGGAVYCREKLVSKLVQNQFGQTFQTGGVTIQFNLICGQFS